MSASASGTSAQPIRLAIVSTPRTGNTWLRHLLWRIWNLQHVAAHDLDDDAWAKLPADCVLQMHWPREPAFVERLAAEGFRVITIGRHPFDVLISILHVAVYGVESERWLSARHGDESSLWGAMPGSRAFIEYAAGPRAAALFQITNGWWQAPGVISLRYEDLVRDPAAVLRGFEQWLGPPRLESIETAIRETSIPKLRLDTGHAQHFWQGRPGLWRELIPAAQAEEMAAALRSTFERLNYPCDPDFALSASQADRNWVNYFGRALRTALERNTEVHVSQRNEMLRYLEESNQAMKGWEARYVGVIAEKQVVESQRDFANRQLEAQQPLVEEAQGKLPLIAGCGRFALRCARIVQACVNRMAWLRPHKSRCRDAGQMYCAR